MKDLTKGTPARIMISFAVPVALGNMFQLCYSLADTRVVGSALGETALAAVGATASISTLFIGFLSGLTNGFSLLIAREFGAGNKEGVKRFAAGSLLLGAVTALSLTLACLAGLPMDPRTFKRAPGASYPIRQLYPRHSVRTVCHHAVQCLAPLSCGL